MNLHKIIDWKDYLELEVDNIAISLSLKQQTASI